MKKIFSISVAAVAILTLFVACSKDVPTTPGNNPEEVSPTGDAVTIKATLSDVLTRVDFTPTITGGKTTAMALAWAEGDKIRVFNHADRDKYDDFTLAAESIGAKEGVFTGTPEHLAGAVSYDVEVINVIGGAEVTDGIIEGGYDFYDQQTQPADGDPGDLKYFAKAKELTDYTDIQFTEISGVLAVAAKLPEGVAGTIKSVDLIASEVLFPGGKELTITLTEPGDVGDDDILNLFATLDTEGVENFQDVNLIVRFHAPESDHKVYTRFVVLNWPKMSPNNLNTLNINASKSDKHAGKATDDGSEDNPYLIGDGYQLAAVDGLALSKSTTFFKLVDDVDMNGITHNCINADENDYSKAVDFNGDDKTIRNLSKSLFSVLKGSVHNLILEHSTITTAGILAEKIQGAGNEVRNVTVLNGTVSASNSQNVGGMIGLIDGSGTEATITDCKVTGTEVTAKSVGGGVIGFADAKVTVSGCQFQSGNVTVNGRYVGGFVGSTGNYESTFTDCQVKATTIYANHTADVRGGGFVGQLQDKVMISGCAVGEDGAKVTVNTKEPTGSNVINVGGFVGVCYGKITKNGDVRSQAFVKITSTNTLGTPLKLGGFVGFHAGNIEYSDAVVDMTGLKGQHIGGFAGYVIKNNATRLGRIDNCFMDGKVTGNNYTGGFAGYVDSGSPAISNSSAVGMVTAQSGCGGFVGQSMTGVFTNDSAVMNCSFSGSNNGGFVGQIHGGTMTGCTAAGSLTRTGGNTYGGFAGLLTNNGTTLDKCSAEVIVTSNDASYNGAFIGIVDSGTVLIKRCFATGNVKSNQSHVSTFVARINQASGKTLNVTIENCFATGSIEGSNQVRGGLVGSAEAATSLTISKCYASGSIVGSFRLGGLIGNLNNTAAVVGNCAAWNSEVTAGTYGNANWSSGAVIGTAHPNSHLTNNYRKHDMSLTAFWVPASDYSQPDVDGSTHPLTDSTGAEMADVTMASGQPHYPIYPYHGKVEAGQTLSWIAEFRLGWSDAIWDFSGPLPLLW